MTYFIVVVYSTPGKVTASGRSAACAASSPFEGIKQERCGEVIDQIQHPCFVPDGIEAEKARKLGG